MLRDGGSSLEDVKVRSLMSDLCFGKEVGSVMGLTVESALLTSTKLLIIVYWKLQTHCKRNYLPS